MDRPTSALVRSVPGYFYASGPKGDVIEVVLVEAGPTYTLGTTGNRRWYDWAPLRAARTLFEGVKLFFHMPRPGKVDHPVEGEPPAEDQVAWVRDVREGISPRTGYPALIGRAHFDLSLPKAAQVRAEVRANLNRYGVSWRAEGTEDQNVLAYGRAWDWLRSVEKVLGLDFVDEPGCIGAGPVALVAGGQAMNLLDAAKPFAKTLFDGVDLSTAKPEDVWKHVHETLTTERFQQLLDESKAAEDVRARIEALVSIDKAAKLYAEGKTTEAEAIVAKIIGAEIVAPKSESDTADANRKAIEDAEAEKRAAAEAAKPAPAAKSDDATKAALAELQLRTEKVETEAAELRKANALSEAEKGGLPSETVTKLAASWKGRKLTQAEIDADIRAERKYLETLTASGKVKGCGSTQVEIHAGMTTEVDRNFVRTLKMFGVGIETPAPKGMEDLFNEVDPFPDMRHMYRAYTGDGGERMTGKIVRENLSPEFRALADLPEYRKRELEQGRRPLILKASKSAQAFLKASITTTDWAYVVENAMTLAALAFYDQTDMPLFRLLTSRRRGIASFDQLKSIRVGEYPVLPEIAAEGDDYDPLTTPDDTRVTWTPKEYGGIETLTRRAMLGDKLGMMSKIPQLFTMAWSETVEQLCADLLIGWNGSTVNAATAYTTRVPYHATDGNIGSADFSRDGITAAISRMRLQAAEGSDRKGIARPTSCVFPPELSTDADVLFGSPADPEGVQSGRKNPVSFLRPIMSNHLRDAENYFVIGQSAPIEFGFVEDLDTPQIWLANDPRQGEAFANGGNQYKIRLECGGALTSVKMIDGSFPT